MADFTLWATVCEPALWPARTFAHAYNANRRAAVEGIIKADPVATCVRALMAERGSWAGTASDLLHAATGLAGNNGSNWPKNPAALAARLRRAQTFLRVLGIELSFTRERRAGTRTIRIIAGGGEPSHHCQCCQHRQHRLPQHLDRPWKPTTTGAFVKPVSDADGADAADASSARHRKSLYGPPSPNAGSTGFARAGTGLQGRRHGCSPAPAGAGERPGRESQVGRSERAGWRCGVRDLDPQLACVLVVLESRNQQRRRVAGSQCHTAPPITSNGARGQAGASTWVA
jgi:hypothetical protein